MFYVNLMVTTRGKPTRDSQKIKERNSKHSTIENHQKEGSKRRGGEGSGTPFQYSCLENPMDGGAWWATVHGVTKSRTRLSDFTFTFHFHALEKEMATHSSVLAWRIPGTGEPGGLPSMGSHRVGHNWSDLAAVVVAQSFSIFGCKEYNESGFGVDHLVMSMCRVFSCGVGTGYFLWPVPYHGKTLLAFALLHLVFQGQICLLLQVSLDFLLFHSSPLWWKGNLLGVLVLEGLVGLHRAIQLQLLQHYWSGHRLLWYWMVCLGNKQRLFCRFWYFTPVWVC